MTRSGLPDDGRTAQATIEASTDASQARLLAACGSQLEPIIASAGRISTRLIEARSAPTDPRKRAGADAGRSGR